jgi:UDP-N-acetylmuramoyl-L-alanyl-D-glutamate--2,6-diaminopimelate ligase
MSGAGSVVRPTPAAFDWAEPFFTVGVTGTNGKTSTTHLIAAALGANGEPVLSESTIGYALDGAPLEVPRTIDGYVQAFRQAREQNCRRAVVEVTSQALALGYAKKWRFDLGVFTNLTRDHLDMHGSWEHYLASKAQLFVHLAPGRSAVLNAADETSLLLDQVTPGDVTRLWYGATSRGRLLQAADLAAETIAVCAAGTRLQLVPSPLAEALGGVIETRLVGQVFAENALAAACAGLAAGVDPSDVVRGIANCEPVPGRFEILATAPVIAVVDYAHTPDALARTCETARALAGDKRVFVVVGAGGGSADKSKREPMGRVVGERADHVIVTNDNPRDEEPAAIARVVASGCRRGGRAYVAVELDRGRAIARALDSARPGDVVIVAGKGHERGQQIGGRSLPFSDVDELCALLGKTP